MSARRLYLSGATFFWVVAGLSQASVVASSRESPEGTQILQSADISHFTLQPGINTKSTSADAYITNVPEMASTTEILQAAVQVDPLNAAVPYPEPVAVSDTLVPVIENEDEPITMLIYVLGAWSVGWIAWVVRPRH